MGIVDISIYKMYCIYWTSPNQPEPRHNVTIVNTMSIGAITLVQALLMLSGVVFASIIITIIAFIWFPSQSMEGVYEEEKLDTKPEGGEGHA